MKIRLADKNDFEEILSLVMKNMEYHMKMNKQDWEPIEDIKREEAKELKEDLKDPKTKIFIAEEDNGSVGYINLSLHKKNPYTKTRRKGEIDDLFVLKKFRKKRIGKALVRNALEYFRSKSVKSVSLSVNSQNIPALKFYENFGFKEVVRKMVLNI